MPRQPSETAPPEGQPSRGGRHPIDVRVGAYVRRRRAVLGMSQEKLAEALGITFQQVQKYERGVNRISASRLFAISQVLGVPIAAFFEDAEGGPDPAPAPESAGAVPPADLLAAFNSIPDPAVRTALVRLARSIAESPPAGAKDDTPS